MNSVEDTAEKIRSMEIRGAGRIARAGAGAIGAFAESYNGSSLADFLSDLDKAKEIILASRPTAVSLYNGVRSSVKGADGCGTVEEAKALVSRNSKEFCEGSEAAVERIAEFGSNLISDGDTILTHCNSSAALGIIKKAHKDGKRIKVYATETRPWRQGILTVNDLANAGVDVTMIVDSAVRMVMQRVDKVFIGADTVMSDGSLVNKVGTSQIASAAREYGRRFYSCAETYKFSPHTIRGEQVEIEERSRYEVVSDGEVLDGVKVFNPVFDTTPARLIDAYITEIGVISPGSVFSVMTGSLGMDTKE